MRDTVWADNMPLTVRFTESDPLVTVLKIEADRHGYDVLYQHNGSAPRWRGFDETDAILVVLDDEGQHSVKA